MQGCVLRVMKDAAPLIAFVLKLPHSPLSPVTEMTSVRLSGEQRMGGGVDAGGDASEHALHLHGVRTRVGDPLLRAAQLGRSDHLHGLRDLLRVLHRADAPAEVNQ